MPPAHVGPFKGVVLRPSPRYSSLSSLPTSLPDSSEYSLPPRWGVKASHWSWRRRLEQNGK